MNTLRWITPVNVTSSTCTIDLIHWCFFLQWAHTVTYSDLEVQIMGEYQQYLSTRYVYEWTLYALHNILSITAIIMQLYLAMNIEAVTHK